MIRNVNGRDLDSRQVFEAVQKDLLGRKSDLLGQVTHVFRFCRQWQEKTKGIPYKNWRDPETDTHKYQFGIGDLPHCVYLYYLEVVEPILKAKAAKQSAE